MVTHSDTVDRHRKDKKLCCDGNWPKYSASAEKEGEDWYMHGGCSHVCLGTIPVPPLLHDQKYHC